MPSIVDRLAEATVVFSYGRAGYHRRRKTWADPDLALDLSGRRILVTGGTSGVGLALCDMLTERGAHVLVGARNRAKAERLIAERSDSAGQWSIVEVDVSSRASVRAAVDALVAEGRPLDALVNNAGVMIHERARSVDDVELTWATNVFGGWGLTLGLRPLLADGGGRVVHVTSGGMYAHKLDVDDPYQEAASSWDGVKAYAQTKRAQVVLNEILAERLAGDGITSNAMHPGWANTPGVEDALPRFYRLLENQLRTPAEGADTAAWLAVSPECASETGQLWLDRVARRTYVVPGTRESDDDRRVLVRMCEAWWAGEPPAPRG